MPSIPPPPPVDWSKRRTGPFPLGGGEGGTKILTEFRIIAPNFVYVWAMHFCRTWGGGGGVFGGGEYYSFEVIVYRKPRRGVRGYPPPTVGTFLGDFRVLIYKPGFGWVIRFKLTSTLAPNVYNDCSIRGEPFFSS